MMGFYLKKKVIMGILFVEEKVLEDIRLRLYDFIKEIDLKALLKIATYENNNLLLN